MKANKPTASTTQAKHPTAKPITPTPGTKATPAKPVKRARIGKGSCGICD